MSEKKAPIKSKIGGQAVIEGIMMRGLDKVSLVVRLASGELDVETWAATSLVNKKWFLKIPIIRGVFGFVESMMLGVKCLMKSAEKMEFEEEEETSENTEEQPALPLSDEQDKKSDDSVLIKVVSAISMVLGVGLSLVLFMWIPSLITKHTTSFFGLDIPWLKTLMAGLIKIALFIVYLALVSKMKDIKRVFMYHGAEHKAIACYEAGDDLTVENVRKHSRFHPRCGTSFIFIVLIISIIVFSFVTWNVLWQRLAIELALLPVVVGVSYELIKLAGKYTNPFTKFLSAPGLALQRLTTIEPEDNMIEVGIKALTEVIPEDRDIDRWDS